MADLTDAQLDRFIDAWVPAPEIRGLIDSSDHVFFRASLDRVSEAGFTIKPPETRVTVQQVDDGTPPHWRVQVDGQTVASFTGPRAKRYACEHGDRLNAEHGGGS